VSDEAERWRQLLADLEQREIPPSPAELTLYDQLLLAADLPDDERRALRARLAALAER